MKNKKENKIMRLKDYFLMFFKGAVIGVANIIPGVSGGTLAVSLGIYEAILGAISNFFKSFKKNILVLLPIILGAVVGILASSKIVTIALDKYKAQTICLFIGLIFGGISLLMRKTRNKNTPSNLIIFFIVFIGVILFNLLVPTAKDISLDNLVFKDYIILLVLGVIASSAMVIPGISGSFIMMLLGYYEPIVETVSNLSDFSAIGHNLSILIPFGIGAIIGIVLISKLIMFLIKKFETKTYFGIMGFVLSSIVILIMEIIPFKYNFTNIFTCILALLWGYLLAKNIEKENDL